MRACCINYLHFFIYLKFTSFSSVFFAELYRSGLLRQSTTSSASIVSFLPFLPANGTEQRSCCIQWQDETRETRWDVQLFRKSTAQDESGESMRKQLCSWNFQIWNLPEGLQLSPDTISHNSAIGVSKSWSTACALQLAMTQSVSSDLFSALTELCWIGLRWCFCWYF